MVSIFPSAATIRCLANVRLAAGSAALQARDVFRTGRPRDRSVVDKHLAWRPASQLRGIVLMLFSTDATQEGGRHGTLRCD